MKFLRAEWRKLLIINYAVDPAILQRYLPFKTEIDTWNNTCYVSLIGFMFKNTRVLGIKFPYHSNFEEVNLRFYVKYKSGSEYRRGVVFISEIVPRKMLAYIANTLYGENYVALKMSHQWVHGKEDLRVAYTWKTGTLNSISAIADPNPVPLINGSEEEFITGHFWGYTKLSDSKTGEYAVEHPSWMLYPVKKSKVIVDFADLYGSDFDFLGDLTPTSVFLAEGSPITVGFRNIIR